MGGFGSGGQRSGAGRKSKRQSERVLTGAKSRTRAADAVAPEVVAMPRGMTPEQVEAWESLAPHAMAAGTLVAATVLAFRDLCEIVALRGDMLRHIAADGVMVAGEPHPLLAHERQYRLREEAGKARFMIAPIGKPMGQTAPKVDDPFAEFDGLTLVKSN